MEIQSCLPACLGEAVQTAQRFKHQSDSLEPLTPCLGTCLESLPSLSSSSSLDLTNSLVLSGLVHKQASSSATLYTVLHDYPKLYYFPAHFPYFCASWHSVHLFLYSWVQQRITLFLFVSLVISLSLSHV